MSARLLGNTHLSTLEARRSSKIAVVTGLHLKFDLMPPLIVFSLVHWVAQPLWWDKETSYYRKYGLGRKTLPPAYWFGVVRNILIYTKEFMMPKKL